MCEEKERKKNLANRRSRSYIKRGSNKKTKEKCIDLDKNESDIKDETIFFPTSSRCQSRNSTYISPSRENSVNMENDDDILSSEISDEYKLFLEMALEKGLKIGKLAFDDVKYVFSKFCRYKDTKYLIQVVAGDILLVGPDQLIVDKTLEEELKEADYRHEVALGFFF